ncbi:MAG: DUF167 domain-containing protein [Candidatus Moranbacteria bacterium]|nr:DUF167 domain-containing protein [Candidatus Moranbacteria bacterium]NTW76018.1 DUF167 domain-containing protein [Candidatus Moranbacteria bacterium]
MKISVTVKPNAKKEGVVPKTDGSLVVSLKAPSREGKANARLPKVLATHFDVAPSCIRIVSGASSRKKIIEIS